MSELGEEIGSHIVAIKRRLARPPATLAHGDFRIDNLFFYESDSDARIVVVDWQAVRVGRGVYDLAYFLATSLAPEMRRDRREPLVSLYHQTLLASGVVGYTVQDCHEDYGYALLDLVSFVTINRVDPRFRQRERGADGRRLHRAAVRRDNRDRHRAALRRPAVIEPIVHATTDGGSSALSSAHCDALAESRPGESRYGAHHPPQWQRR